MLMIMITINLLLLFFNCFDLINTILICGNRVSPNELFSHTFYIKDCVNWKNNLFDATASSTEN